MLLAGTREAEPWQSTGRPRWKRDRLQRGDHSQHRETLERNQVFGWPGQHNTFKATREKSSKSPGLRSWHRSRRNSWASLSAQGTKMDFQGCSWNPSAVQSFSGQDRKAPRWSLGEDRELHEGFESSPKSAPSLHPQGWSGARCRAQEIQK